MGDEDNEPSADPFAFELAEALGMTLEQLGDMAYREYIAWQAFTNWRNAKRDLAAKKAGYA